MPEPLPRMTATESRAWIALVSTAELLPTALDAQLQRDSHLTHYEFIVLTTLQRAGKAIRLSELAEATNATLPRASKVITRMADRDLVARTPSTVDKRAVDVQITRAGRRRLVLATPGHFDTVRTLVLDHLDETQLVALADALEPILGGLDPQTRFAQPPRHDAPGDDAAG